mgnify:CR=1 FL=1
MMNFLLSLPDLVLVILGFIFLIFGGESVVQGAITIARKMNVSPLLIGFTIVAIGTSLPELAVTMIAALRGHKGVAIGNVLGSNVINILGILGISSAYAGGILVSEEFAGRDIWVVLVTSGLVAAMLLNERKITKTLGVVMVIGYLSYMTLLYTI